MDSTARSEVLSGRATVRLAGALLAALMPAFAGANDPPKRVVSLNPCLDAILVAIAPREQIAALSFRARDPSQSVLVEIAKTYPITYETAEEVVALRPDLVLATRHSALATRNALRRVGIRIIVYKVPDSVEASYEQIRAVAHEIGREEAGQALIARLQSAVHAARGSSQTPTLIFQSSGLTPGSGTLISELMQIVGFKNVAERYGIQHWGTLTVEQIVSDPPQLLLVGEVSPGAPGWAERRVQHPALRYLANESMVRTTFPARLLYCGGPVIELALQSLTAARDAYDAKARP